MKAKVKKQFPSAFCYQNQGVGYPTKNSLYFVARINRQDHSYFYGAGTTARKAWTELAAKLKI